MRPVTVSHVGRPDASVTRIAGGRRWFPDLRELFRYRRLVALMGRPDITVRFRQTILGTTWLVAGALVTAGLFSFVFGRIADLPTGGVPYFVFSFAGLLTWNLFANVLTSTSTSFVPNASLISKIYFPRLVLPLSTMPFNLVNVALNFVILCGLLVAFSVAFTAQLLLVWVWLLLALALGLGIGLVFAAFSVSYRDVNYITPILVSLLLYLTPVAYSLEAVPASLQNVYLLNPMASVIEGTRWSVLGTAPLPPAWAIAYTVVSAVVLLVIGLATFAHREPGFADVI